MSFLSYRSGPFSLLQISFSLKMIKVNKNKTGQMRLEKLNKLGGGAYGSVYSAKAYTPGKTKMLLPMQEPQEEVYAVKRNFISPSVEGTIGSVRELDFLNLIKDHPFCIQLKDVSFEQPFVGSAMSPNRKDSVTDRVYFILEKGTCDGERFIYKKPLITDKKLFAVQTLLAIEFLHSRKIYHRDLKPANIICLLSPGDELLAAKITDFGLAQYHTSQSLSLPGIVTRWYRAPEISLNKDYTLSVDVWSLGCIFFELFSHDNRRFIQPNSDYELLNLIIEKIPFPTEFYLLAQQIYPKKITKSYAGSQQSLRSMKQMLGLTGSEMAQFNSSELVGKSNYGSLDELCDLLEHMLISDPKNRWTAAECLNHPFFRGYQELIDKTRTKFGLSNKGIWTLEPDYKIVYHNTPVRSVAMKWFSLVYSHRTGYPIRQWYSPRIFFHALEIFDRYLEFVIVEPTVQEYDIVVWIDVCLFVSAKYFRVLLTEHGLEMFAIGVNPDEIFLDRARTFEEILIRDILRFVIYRPTIYEIAQDFLTEASTNYLIQLIIRGMVPSGTSLKKLWSVCSEMLLTINKGPTPKLLKS